MSMINLNDEVFNGGNNIQIFNNGVAGRVDNVIGSKIERKTPEDMDIAPDYKLYFKDKDGAEINVGFWYLDPNKPTFAKDLEKQGKSLKHLIHCYYGDSYQFPAFNSPKEMLDGCIKLINAKFTSVLVRVYCTYGTTQYPKKYLQLRSYVPFIESMSVSLSETRLKSNSIDQMTRLEEDKPISASSFSNAESVI